MEWTALNITAFAVFALCENILYILMRKAKDEKTASVCAVFSVALYVLALFFLLLYGATLKQTALVVLASLPGAFIPVKRP